MAKNFKIVKGVSTTPLKKLNEGQELKNPNKYVFQGVFTACSTPEHKIVNRNGRIYMESEVLRHLGYLRDMIKENNGRILGELDHPEGRFDVQMKEASHMITDLWYDDKTKCVMGRLEVLDTPNGQTLKSLIDAGFPLYVSSRAAGDVNEKTKEVEIAQIFTYDVVCTPGFKEARLERVNESVLNPKALKYINEAVSMANKSAVKDIIVPSNVINEGAISAFDGIRVEDVIRPLNEEDEPMLDTKDMFPVMDGNQTDLNEEDEGTEDTTEEEKENDDDKKGDEEKSESEPLSDSDKEKNAEDILSIEAFDGEGNPISSGSEDSSVDVNADDILDIEAVGEDDNEDHSEEGDNGDGETSAEEADAMEDVEENEDKQKKLKKDTDKDIAELESILDSVQKTESVKESIIKRYPFSISLSESNFAKFASLRPNYKKRCSDFIEEHEIYDIRAINEFWSTPLQEAKKNQSNWLKLASPSDRDLYVKAPIDVQNAIEETAKYVKLDTQEEVDEFWNRTGLRQQNAQRLLNEERVRQYNNQLYENEQFRQNNPMGYQLGYSFDIVKMTEDMMKD